MDRHRALKLSAADIHAITRQAPIYLSPVNVAEIRYGIDLMKDAKQKLRAMTMLRRMRRKPLLRITSEIGEVFGMIAAKLTQAGRGADFRTQDLWLASQAIQLTHGQHGGAGHMVCQFAKGEWRTAQAA